MKTGMITVRNDKMCEEMNKQIHSWMKLCFEQIIDKFIHASIHELRNSVMDSFMNTCMNTAMKIIMYVSCHQLNSVFSNLFTDTLIPEIMNVFGNENDKEGIHSSMKTGMYQFMYRLINSRM